MPIVVITAFTVDTILAIDYSAEKFIDTLLAIPSLNGKRPCSPKDTPEATSSIKAEPRDMADAVACVKSLVANMRVEEHSLKIGGAAI